MRAPSTSTNTSVAHFTVVKKMSSSIRAKSPFGASVVCGKSREHAVATRTRARTNRGASRLRRRTARAARGMSSKFGRSARDFAPNWQRSTWNDRLYQQDAGTSSNSVGSNRGFGHSGAPRVPPGSRGCRLRCGSRAPPAAVAQPVYEVLVPRDVTAQRIGVGAQVAPDDSRPRYCARSTKQRDDLDQQITPGGGLPDRHVERPGAGHLIAEVPPFVLVVLKPLRLHRFHQDLAIPQHPPLRV